MDYRLLKASEIDARVGTVGAKGVTLLLYKDARVDMAILDETHGSEFWQRDHREIKGHMYAGVGVWNKEIKQFIWKWDCGTESFTEKEKGEASDSFKRACVNVGIGRELYTSPFIFIQAETTKKDRGYDLVNKYEFNGCKVSKISYTENREVKEVEIVNKKGDVIYPKFNKKKYDPPKDEPDFEALEKKTEKHRKEKIGTVEAIALDKRLENHGIDKLKFLSTYEVSSLEEMTNGDWDKANTAIKQKYEK